MRDADAESGDYRTDGTPTGASRLRVPKMRVCHERLGAKRNGPPDGSATEGWRRSRLARLIFHPRNFYIISALGRAIPASFIVAGADEVTEVVLLAAVHMSLPGTTCAERIVRTFRGQPVRRLHHYPR